MSKVQGRSGKRVIRPWTSDVGPYDSATAGRGGPAAAG